MGISPDKVCLDADKPQTPSAACVAKMTDYIADLGLQRLHLFPQAFSHGTPQSSLADLQRLVQLPVFEEAQKQILAIIKKEHHQEDLDTRVRDQIFPKIKELLIGRIGNMPGDEEIKQNLINKVHAIKYSGSDCDHLGGIIETVNMDLALMPNAFYNTEANDFHFCTGLRIHNTSDFQLAFIIAHELSHSLDPCGASMGPSDYSIRYQHKPIQDQEDEAGQLSRAEAESQYIWPKLVSCLRSGSSVHALVRTDTSSSSKAVGSKVKTTTTKGPADFSEKGFCSNDDQIGESFADWMASEILPTYMDLTYADSSDPAKHLTPEQFRVGYSNVWRGFCVNRLHDLFEQDEFDVHPSEEDRTNKIILMQPHIRTQMGCPEKLTGRTYCDANGPADEKGSKNKKKDETRDVEVTQ